MYKLHVLISLVIVLLLSACSSPFAVKPDIYHESRKKSGYETLHVPEVGVVSTTGVGEDMYMKVRRLNPQTYSVRLQGETSGLYGKDYTYSSVALGFDGGSSTFATKNKMAGFFAEESFVLREWPRRKYKTICSSENICLADIKDDMYFSHKSEYPYKKLEELDAPIKYNLIKTPPVYDNDSFKYVVIYKGRFGGDIKVSFIEYNKDMVSPTFTQDMTYKLDKNQDTVIGFKGLRINVTEATDLDITYTVVNDYK